MSEVIYRKYRPQSFDELVGQEQIVRTLQNALSSGRISHAYLFYGPKGTGKTSTARIFAKAINCLSKKEKENYFFRKNPCLKCEHCEAIKAGSYLDMIEIDAASNRGIEEIRELREKVNYPPVSGKYKIYIIDEVHMLTTEASNALLKTLEEPPKHVVFILCTTEIHKILATVISRCQRYDFRRASTKDILKRLEQILEKEGRKIKKEGLFQIAQNASGGFRDAEALLDKLLSLSDENEIQEAELSKFLGLIDQGVISDILISFLEKDALRSIEAINNLQDKNVNLEQAVKRMIFYLRKALLVKIGLGEKILELSEEEYEDLFQKSKAWEEREISVLIQELEEVSRAMKFATILSLPLEMLAIKRSIQKEEKKEDLKPDREKEINKKAVIKSGKKIMMITQKPGINNIPSQSNIPDDKLLSEIVLKWQEILKAVKPRNHSIEALLKACEPVAVLGDTLHLNFFYPFHKERIEAVKSREIVEETVSKVMGRQLSIKCVLSVKKAEKNMAGKETKLQEDLLSAVNDIFEVKES